MPKEKEEEKKEEEIEEPIEIGVEPDVKPFALKEEGEIKKLKDIRDLFKPHSTVPTHIPKSFEEQFYLYESGGTRIFYIWIKGSWEALETIDIDLFIRKDGSIAFTGNQSMGGKKLTNLPAPAADGDAARKKYIDDLINSIVTTNIKEYTAGEGITIRQLCSLGHETTINGTTILRDSYVSKSTGEKDTNYGSSTIIRIRQDASAKFTKGLIWFDISSLPDGDDVDSVKLKLYVSATQGVGGDDYIVIGTKRVAATWVEGVVTWNNKPGEAGEHGESEEIKSTGWIEIDVTDLYKEWKAGTHANYGIYLYWKAASGGVPAYIDMNSKEAGSNKPYLYITYRGDKDKVWAADVSNWMGAFLAGFATETKTTDDIIKIQNSGSLGGFSGLTEGQLYYASNSPGAISTTAGTVKRCIGIALFPNLMLIYQKVIDYIEIYPTAKYVYFISDDTYKASDSGEETDLTTYEKKKEFTLPTDFPIQNVRVRFELWGYANASDADTYGKIYKNGSPYGTERHQSPVAAPGAWAGWSQDLEFTGGDKIQLYIKKSATSGLPGKCRYFRVLGTEVHSKFNIT